MPPPRAYLSREARTLLLTSGAGKGSGRAVGVFLTVTVTFKLNK